MGYESVPLVKRGDLWTAADHNKYLKNNFAATEQAIVTTAGDMVYASAANTLARLPITAGGLMTCGSAAPAWKAPGSAYDILRTNLGLTAIEWAGIPPGEVALKSFQNIAHDTQTAISFTSASITTYGMWSAGAPTRITIPSGFPAGAYLIFCSTAITFPGPGLMQINAKISGGGIEPGATIYTSKVVNYRISFCYVRNLYAGDYVEFIAYHNTGSTYAFTDIRAGVMAEY